LVRNLGFFTFGAHGEGQPTSDGLAAFDYLIGILEIVAGLAIREVGTNQMMDSLRAESLNSGLAGKGGTMISGKMSEIRLGCLAACGCGSHGFVQFCSYPRHTRTRRNCHARRVFS
jgi:hypothetical protein